MADFEARFRADDKKRAATPSLKQAKKAFEDVDNLTISPSGSKIGEPERKKARIESQDLNPSENERLQRQKGGLRLGPMPDWFESDPKRPVMMGVDEAGRGSVIGPMPYGGCYWPIDRNEELSKKGFDDSKKLTEGERDKLLQKVYDTTEAGWVLRVIPASEISEGMLQRTPVSLNKMAHSATIDMIRAVVNAGVNLKEVYVDTVGLPEVYENMLTRAFSGEIAFTVRKKADSLFKCVSAASIVAKCCRDDLTARWLFKEKGVDFDRDYGCGYPSDPKTLKWLERNREYVFGFSDFARFSWKTLAPMMDEHCAKVEWEEEEDEAAKGSMKMTDMFAKSNEVKRCKYFTTLGLKHFADL